jgi:branched-subunit amino acid transport protein
MSDATTVLIVMTVGTFALKSAGPLVLGDRALPVRIRQVIDLLPAALLAALAVVSTVGEGREIVIDARLVGLVVAGLALWRRAPFVVVILLASTATALVRLMTQ